MRDEEKRHYWRKNVQLITVLLAVWAMVSLVGGILAVEVLNRIAFGQLPLGFWMAQQGAIFVFVVLIFVYARAMDRIDRSHHADE